MHIMNRRTGSLLVAVVAALGFTLSSTGPSTAATAAPPRAAGAGVVYIEYSPGQSLTSAVLHESAMSSTYAAKVRALVPAWEREVSAGKDPGLPGVTGKPKADQLAALGELNTDLGRQAAGLAVPAIDYGDPNTFPIRGQRDSSGWFWTGTWENDLDACSDECEVTDRFRSNVTIDPGATITRVTSSGNLYFPDAGNFQNNHFQIFAVCSGSVCSSIDTGNLSSTSNNTIEDYGDRHLKVLTIGIDLWTYVVPFESYIADAGKTHDCTGESVVLGNGCYYSY